jgi:ankyrin repeat protein
MLASCDGHPECVKLLLAAKADVNYTNKDGNSALIQVCQCNESGPHTEVIKLLIEAKADVNHKGFLNRTALMRACTNGNEAAVKLLIAAKADVDSADYRGYTALMKAFDHPGIVKLLIEAKADVNRANARGYTALMNACYTGSETILAVVKLLLAVPGIDIDHVNSDGETALSLAKALKPDDENEDEDDYEPEEWEEILREREERYQRRLSLVPLLEEKMRQQAIDAEVAAAVKRIDAAAAK